LIRGSLSPYQWRRTYTSPSDRLNGTEWSLSKTERYVTKSSDAIIVANSPITDSLFTLPIFNHSLLNLRIARPVIDPLYQATNIHSDYEMKIERDTIDGVNLACASVIDPSRYAPEGYPDFVFPTMCFDGEMHLRLTNATKTTVQFGNIQPFQKRSVAREIKINEDGNLVAALTVTLLEPWAEANAGFIKPDKTAMPEPYHIEPGFPRPESVYEVGASIPFTPENKPYRGAFLVPVRIQKDGSVKADPNLLRGGSNLFEALSDAINKWKFKPYLVDGQPVEVSWTIIYPLDGKPFVPSYERPKPAPVVTAPEDFSSAYDPKRDPEKDLATAQAAAAKDHKRILMEVGGDWCFWCKTLDTFYADHPELRQQRDANFVVLKVYMGPRNENVAFLSRFPKIPGYPYFFVLDADGKVLGTKDTSPLENAAHGYSTKEMKDFLSAWNRQ